MCSNADFIVGKEEYSPKTFLDQFSKHLPRLVKITKGYYGEEQIETFEIGQVLFIRNSGSQERVVASVLQGPRSLAHKLLSIPLDYNAHFRFVSDKREKEKLKLRKVLSKKPLPIDVIFIPELTSNDLHLSSPSRLMSNDDRLVLSLTHRYHDSFLLGHTLCKDKVTSIIQQLPLFLTDMRVSLVVGRVGFGTQEWNSYLHKLTENCANKINSDYITGNPDIAVYDRDLDDCDVSVQVPKIYCTLMDCSTDNNVFEDNCNAYEVIASWSRTNPLNETPPKLLMKAAPPCARSSVDVSGEGDDTPPDIPERSSLTIPMVDRRQQSLSRLSGEYEEIVFTSRKKVLGKSSFYGNPEKGKKKTSQFPLK